ncbi:hypothetical protein E5843_07030 [Luteimonas yindakuii]|uniref:hypothetical protein n=1 Tax=Luteimonas yindakuii TaxID=2565782 RepID=UPI0010A3DBBF|nr:hypothetical protein [Luteimonas yindakuii]QCO67586.1 hypothetical protein E5843_07030 [Luteimonas yindakuii]
MRRYSERFLVVYSGALTVALAAILLTGARETRTATFDEIDVQRINVREPDGTLRMTVSGRERFPGGIVKGREFPFDRGVAGMIFYNDEGTETGGLVFRGEAGEDGRPVTTGHLSFDPYHRDQALGLSVRQFGGGYESGLTINDVGDTPIEELLQAMERIRALPKAERAAAQQEFAAGAQPLVPRLFVGRTHDGMAALQLRDGDGKTRLQFRVDEDGAARIDFLDAGGRVQRTLRADDAGAAGDAAGSDA